MSLTLINAAPSPYGRKVAIAMLEKGLAFDVRYDLPWQAGSCTPEFSPFQQLPILVTEDDERVYDSSFILEWLEHCHPDPPLLPSGEARIDALKLRMLGERLMEFAQSMIFETHRPDPSQAWIDRQATKVIGGLAEVERLVGTRAPAINQPIHIGDIAVATTLLVWEFVVADGLSPDLEPFRWRERNGVLAAYTDALERRESFVRTRPQSMAVNIGATVA